MIVKTLIPVGLAVMFTISGIIDFLKTKHKAEMRFYSYRARAKSIESNYGKMWYIDEGAGEPVISVHGICGGYDQGVDTLTNLTDCIRVIAPARFGYDGSEVPKGATIAMQSDVYVEILNHLEIDKTYILATSAGGTSAMRFALDHPERAKGLILYCSGYPALEKSEKKITMAGPPSAVVNDFMMWLISPLFRILMGMDRSILASIMPLSVKKDGVRFDSIHTNTDAINYHEDYDLSKLRVPVLIVHSIDDKLARIEFVKMWLKKIPNCTFVPVEVGGHMMSGNDETINNALLNFIGENK